MIWLRRTLAVLLAVLFVPVLLLTLVVLRVNGTLLEPDFYKDELRKAHLFSFLYDDVLPVAVDDALSGDTELPSGLNLTGEVVSARVQSVVPPEWIQAQVEDAVDEVGPYLAGRSEGFTIVLPLADRARAALEVVKEQLRTADLQGFLMDELIGPAMEQELGAGISLPLGITLTSEEIRDALDQVFTAEWVRGQTDQLVDEVGPYMTGAAPGFEITLVVSDRVDAAMDVLDRVLERKLAEIVAATPTCTTQQLLDLASAGFGEDRPDCLPQGFTVELFTSQFDLDVTGEMRQVLAGRLTDDLTYTDADLRQALSGGDSEALDTLDTVRETIRDGWTFTQVDLRDALDEDRGSATLEDFDQARSLLDTARGLWFLLPITVAVLLAVIGVLGGRGVGGKAACAGAVLALAAAVTLGVTTVARGMVWGRLDDLRADQLGDGGLVETLLIDKGFLVANSVLGDFLGWVTTVSLALAVVGMVVAAAGVALPKLTSRSQPAEETAAE